MKREESKRTISRAFSADTKRTLKESMFTQPTEFQKYNTGAIRNKPSHSTSADLKERIENFKEVKKIGSTLKKSSSLEVYNSNGTKISEFDITISEIIK